MRRHADFGTVVLPDTRVGMLGHRFPGLREMRIEADAPDLDHTHSRQDCNRVGNVVVLRSTPLDVFQDDEVVLRGWLLQGSIAGCCAFLELALHEIIVVSVLIDLTDKRYG